MHPADIQAALKKKGYTQKDFAKEINVCPMSVSIEIAQDHRGGSERVRQAIAAKIGLPASVVFTEKYAFLRTRRIRKGQFGYKG